METVMDKPVKTNKWGRKVDVMMIEEGNEFVAETTEERTYKYTVTNRYCACGATVVIGDEYPPFAFIGGTMIARQSLCDSCGVSHFGEIPPA